MEPASEIAIAELADELGTYRASLFKIAKRLNIQTLKRRDSTRGGQAIAFVSATDAARLRAEVSQRASSLAAQPDDLPTDVETGIFYLIQLEPELEPGRFKLGFTTDADGRLRHHRCSAPFAAYVASWPCRRTWERAAIDCMTVGCPQLHTEVFRADSLDEVRARGERFFAMMPRLAAPPDEAGGSEPEGEEAAEQGVAPDGRPQSAARG